VALEAEVVVAQLVELARVARVALVPGGGAEHCEPV